MAKARFSAQKVPFSRRKWAKSYFSFRVPLEKRGFARNIIQKQFPLQFVSRPMILTVIFSIPESYDVISFYICENFSIVDLKFLFKSANTMILPKVC